MHPGLVSSVNDESVDTAAIVVVGFVISGNDCRLRKLLLALEILVPFAVLIHTVGCAQLLKLFFVGTAVGELYSCLPVHGDIVHVGKLQLRDGITAFRTGLFVPV